MANQQPAEPVPDFVETLAQSLQTEAAKGAASAPSAANAPGVSTDEQSDDEGKDGGVGSGELALALVSQSLAAAMGLPVVIPPMALAAQSGATPSANSSQATGAIDSDGSASGASDGSPIQALVTLLAADAAAQAKGQGTPAPAQADASASASAGGTATTAAGDPNSAAANAPAMAHLGIASHFSVQHSAADSNTASGQLRSPVGTPAWQDELGGQISWMAHQGLESASLTLSPEHLGPVEVRISVHGGDASVWFGAAQPDTRAALEQALPRLREMFATQGLNLSQSGVSQESPRNFSRPSQPPAIAALGAVGSAESTSSSVARLSLGLVDTYA